MSEKWDGKVVMSTPGGPIVTMSLGDLLARKDAEIERLRAEIERLREALTDVANQETTGPYKWQLVVVRLCEIARETLEGKP